MTGYHGVTELERKVGTVFCIDMVINIKEHPQGQILQLSDTIDYSSVYELLKTEFSISEQLLESLGNRISEKILNTFSIAYHVDITIMKLKAPITGLEGKVGVKISKTR